jgi:hypothetical protein
MRTGSAAALGVACETYDSSTGSVVQEVFDFSRSQSAVRVSDIDAKLLEKSGQRFAHLLVGPFAWYEGTCPPANHYLPRPLRTFGLEGKIAPLGHVAPGSGRRERTDSRSDAEIIGALCGVYFGAYGSVLQTESGFDHLSLLAERGDSDFCTALYRNDTSIGELKDKFRTEACTNERHFI